MSVATELDWDYPDHVAVPPHRVPPRRERVLASVPCGTHAGARAAALAAARAAARAAALAPEPAAAGLPTRVAPLPSGPLASVSVLAPPTDLDAPPLRLTRRGIVVVALAVAALAIAIVWLAAASASSSGSASGRPAHEPATVTVRPGDTLWSIAGRIAPERDPRSTVDQLARVNHLSGAAVVPGQALRTR